MLSTLNHSLTILFFTGDVLYDMQVFKRATFAAALQWVHHSKADVEFSVLISACQAQHDKSFCDIFQQHELKVWHKIELLCIKLEFRINDR